MCDSSLHALITQLSTSLCQAHSKMLFISKICTSAFHWAISLPLAHPADILSHSTGILEATGVNKYSPLVIRTSSQSFYETIPKRKNWEPLCSHTGLHWGKKNTSIFNSFVAQETEVDPLESISQQVKPEPASMSCAVKIQPGSLGLPQWCVQLAP